MDALNLIFERLNDWRRLPNYQLERRADIFFAIYLPALLQERVGIAIRPQLVPEFPLHLKTLNWGCASNQSVKVDYLAVAEDLSRAFLIELKTDMLSRRDEQDGYLKAAQSFEMRVLVEGIKTICGATQSRNKYSRLLVLLGDIGLLTLPEALREKLTSGQNLTQDDLQRALVRKVACKPEVIYLQPQADGKDTIGFADMATWLERYTDPFSQRFRGALIDWATAVT